MEVRQENAVRAFKRLCGPFDPARGRDDPNTLR